MVSAGAFLRYLAALPARHFLPGSDRTFALASTDSTTVEQRVPSTGLWQTAVYSPSAQPRTSFSGTTDADHRGPRTRMATTPGGPTGPG